MLILFTCFWGIYKLIHAFLFYRKQNNTMYQYDNIYTIDFLMMKKMMTLKIIWIGGRIVIWGRMGPIPS
jgi:uncharacterized membrane protein (UPF0127 family)